MKIKEWVVENLAFLLTLVFSAIALYATFNNLVYRMDQVEARISQIEGIIIPKSEFETIKGQVQDIWKYLLDR